MSIGSGSKTAGRASNRGRKSRGASARHQRQVALAERQDNRGRCPPINRGAQNGSGTPLKMLILLRCIAVCPAAVPSGSPCPVYPWRNLINQRQSRSTLTGGSIIPV